MNKIKGDLYELQIKDHIINNLNKRAYLWQHTPESILIDNGIIGSHNEHRLRRKANRENPLQDTGIDIIQVEDDDSCSLVQCKNGYKKGVTMKDLAGFNAWMTALDKINGYVYYSDKLSQNVISLPKNKRVTYIKKEYIEPIQNKDNSFIIDPNKLKYQEKAKILADEHYKTKTRGILSMPCGTGKTYTSYLISQKYKQIILLSPLKQFAKQNLDRFNEYGYKNKSLLVDSDGERDINTIKKFIKANKSFIISATYASVDVIYESIEYMTNPFIIIDEFHNLSKTNVIDEDDDFNKLLNSDHKILFMSATPRIYELENEDDDYNEDIFGTTIFKMSFTEAIKNKYITDYRIWLPSIHEDNTKLDNELSVYDIDNVIKSKCVFLFSCLLNNGSRKCIIYCIDTNEIEIMKNAIDKLNEYYYLDYNIRQITNKDNEKSRNDILNEFAKSKEIELLFSVRILDECVDIPTCDSIFITYPSQSKIRNVQRLCRCIRTDDTNKFKIGNVFIWCDEYEKILQTLSGIKEYDEEFKDKIKVNQNNFFGEKKNTQFNNDVTLIKKYVVGVKEFRQITWDEKKDLLFAYCDKEKKTPTSKIEYGNYKIGSWFHDQKKKIKNTESELYKKLSKNKIIEHNLNIFLKKKDKIKLNWNEMCQLIFDYCDKEKVVPIYNTQYKNQKIGIWLHNQKGKIKDINSEQYKKLSANEIIKNNLNEYLKNRELAGNKVKFTWDELCKLLFDYCNKEHVVPTKKIIYSGQKIGIWLYKQKENIVDTNSELYIKLSKNEIVKNSLDQYLDHTKLWNDRCKLLFEYCNINNKIPSTRTVYNNFSIGQWLNHQKKSIKDTNSEHYKKMCTNKFVKDDLDNFLERKKTKKDKVILTWNESCKLLFEYCNNEKNVLLHNTIYKDHNIGTWFINQKRFIKDTNDELYKKLSVNKIVKKYLDQFLKNKNKLKLTWDEMCKLVFDYCNKEKKIPSRQMVYKNYNIGIWLSNNKRKIQDVNSVKYKKLSMNRIIKDYLDKYLSKKIK